LIVVGGGVAGIQAALEAKKLQPRKTVAIASDGITPYSRPSLPAVISGEVNIVDKIAIFPPETLRNSHIQLYSGQVILGIEHSTHSVNVKRNAAVDHDLPSRLTYERLIIATGATPLVPRTQGTKLTGVFTLRKFEEALTASKFIASRMRGHVIGAGFVGLETAEALTRRGVDVTLVEVRPSILGRILEPDLGDVLVDRAQTHGVRVLKGVILEKIEGTEKVEHVVISGEKLKSDIVIFATGVSPETELAQSMGLTVSQNGAIKTDANMQTNLNGVYATGDCSESIDFVSGKSLYRPLASIASQTAKIAAANAVGIQKPYEGIIRRQYNKIYGTEIISIGLSVEEANNIGIKAKAFKVQVKKPELFTFSQVTPRTLMRAVVDQDTNVLIGWQAVGSRQTSFFSSYFYDSIFHRRKLEDIEASALRPELAFEE
jgi:NADPH-dependent 2,4-dienoyl-CoA reductase/sulfur reductase-like enzyme